jgi:hypothetical protein
MAGLVAEGGAILVEGLVVPPDVQVQVPVHGYPVVRPRGELALGSPQVALPYPIEKSTQLTLYEVGEKCSVYIHSSVILKFVYKNVLLYKDTNA